MPRMKKPKTNEKKRRKRSGRKAAPVIKEHAPVIDNSIKCPGNPFYNLGGHLIDPAERCPWQRTANDGGVWTDLACCQALCDNHCERYRWFKRASHRARIEDARERGARL